MPVARIDDPGFDIYYEDSGAPQHVEDYTTLVFVHGLIFNSGTFRRMLPFASKYGLRIITMNLRDHYESSPYSDEDLAEMAHPDPAVQAVAVQKHGREVASFLLHVCDTFSIPCRAVHREKECGGLVLVSWSLSNIATMAILGDPATLIGSQELKLSRFLREVVLYDPPSLVYGVRPDLGLKFPFTDQDVPVDDRPLAFVRWAAEEYTAMPSEAPPITAEMVRQRKVDPDRTPSMHDLPAADFERFIEPKVAFRSGRIMQTDDAILQRNARRSLFGTNLILPDVGILALWCDRAPYTNIWGAKTLHDMLREADPTNQRRISLLRIENANHFYHWEEPEKLVRLLAGKV